MGSGGGGLGHDQLLRAAQGWELLSPLLGIGGVPGVTVCRDLYGKLCYTLKHSTFLKHLVEILHLCLE